MKYENVRRRCMYVGLLALGLLQIAAGSTTALAAEESVQVGGVVVTGRASSYKAVSTVSSLRTETPLRETPQSITVVPLQVFADIQAARVDDVLEYAGGFTRGNNFSNQGMSDFNIRGFTGNEYFRNGFPINRGYPAAPDSVAVDRIDVMRGPAALLYGRGDPGGTFNIVTARPSEMAGYTVNLRANTYGNFRGSVNATGPITGDKALRYAVGFAAEHGKTFRDFTTTDRVVFAPTLSWQAGPNTTVTLSTEFTQNHAPFDRGIPAYRTQLPIEIPASRFFGDPNSGRFTSRNGIGQLFVDHKISDDWKLWAGIQYYNGKMGGRGSQPSSLRPDGRTIVRTYSDRTLAWGDVNLQANITGKVNTGRVQHTLLFGVEHEQFRYTEIIRNSNTTTHPFTIDLFAPVYYQQLPPLTNSPSNIKDVTQTFAGYAQDQISVTSQLKLILGGRVERYESANQNRAARTTTEFQQTVVTPRLGAVYLVNDQISVYGSFSRSNKPQTGRDINLNVLDPERGKAFEGGVKLELFDGKLSLSAAAFHIVKQNVSTPDPNNVNFRIAAGEVRSRGFELNYAGNITRAWRIIGGIQSISAKVTKDNNATLLGLRLPNAPKFSATALSVYEFQDGPLRGLGAGAGVTHMGQRFTSIATTASIVPSYTVVNLLAYYPITERVRLQVNVANLFDKNYAERPFGNNIYPGQPLTATGSLTMNF